MFPKYPISKPIPQEPLLLIIFGFLLFCTQTPLEVGWGYLVLYHTMYLHYLCTLTLPLGSSALICTVCMIIFAFLMHLVLYS